MHHAASSWRFAKQLRDAQECKGVHSQAHALMVSCAALAGRCRQEAAQPQTRSTLQHHPLRCQDCVSTKISSAALTRPALCCKPLSPLFVSLWGCVVIRLCFSKGTPATKCKFDECVLHNVSFLFVLYCCSLSVFDLPVIAVRHVAHSFRQQCRRAAATQIQRAPSIR